MSRILRPLCQFLWSRTRGWEVWVERMVIVVMALPTFAMMLASPFCILMISRAIWTGGDPWPWALGFVFTTLLLGPTCRFSMWMLDQLPD